MLRTHYRQPIDWTVKALLRTAEWTLIACSSQVDRTMMQSSGDLTEPALERLSTI